MQASNPKLAGFDWRGFARACEEKRRGEDLSMRALADLLGLTAKDISHACGGHVVGVAKVIALARWLERPVDDWFIEPMPEQEKSACYGRRNVKQREVRA